ncbi:MAG: hypothetical protein ACI9XP_001281 [Lentimonas sp.]|jgi:uncharacterized protein (DUF1015 family)
MSIIKAFKALRPVKDKVHLVATRPYYSYKKKILRAKLQSNPYTFLRIINPEFGLPKEERKAKTRKAHTDLVSIKYKEFIDKQVLIVDEVESLYLYRQTINNHSFIGIIGGASVEEYQKGKIKKHEATITSREEMFTEYLDVVGYNAEPVLLSHSPNEKLNQLYADLTTSSPEYHFTTTDTVEHELWIVEGDKKNEIINLFEEIDFAYIADGHHRCASSSRLKNRRVKKGIECKNQDFFLSFFIDETKIKVYEYNRLVKNIGNVSKEDFVNQLSQHFTVLPLEGPAKPRKEHEIVLLFEDSWYLLNCKAEIINEAHPVQSLDSEILTTHILGPLLDIRDLKTDRNIDFISGTESRKKMLDKMTRYGYEIAFLLYPVNVEQIKKVADNLMIMPPKSTWVEPKMRSGLTIYNINE